MRVQELYVVHRDEVEVGEMRKEGGGETLGAARGRERKNGYIEGCLRLGDGIGIVGEDGEGEGVGRGLKGGAVEVVRIFDRKERSGKDAEERGLRGEG